ncbi:MAG: tyrosine--tRNA ligase [Candidatus Kerfeldbacteria bacterium]|nr:tyrosine--tRNA ligase [Candidatus Kerfeldbacteria bacterium]
MTIEQPQADLLERGVAEIINRTSLEAKLRRRRPLRVKFGVDPTGYHLHLGHAVPLRKLAAWQRAGHHIILIIGDYTAQVGDPSGRDKTRSSLTAEQTKDYSQTYLQQIGKILDVRRVEVRYNSEWYDRLSAKNFLRLLGQGSVNHIMAHETFRRRLDLGQGLGVHELVYPLLQGYDSVEVRADVELGGTDQKFNLLMGRDIQAANKQDQQDVMMMEYLLGTDGKEKMSKTSNNFIALEDPPGEMYGKTMSIPDKMIVSFFTLCTDEPLERIAEIEHGLKKKTENPKKWKQKLARDIVGIYHGTAAADEAELEFTKVFSHKGLPKTIPRARIKPGRHYLINLLVSQRLVTSRSEARRLIEQGGVKVNDQVVKDWQNEVTIQNGTVLQVGKRRFMKLVAD